MFSQHHTPFRLKLHALAYEVQSTKQRTPRPLDPERRRPAPQLAPNATQPLLDKRHYRSRHEKTGVDMDGVEGGAPFSSG
jgi:hypothetical protein